MDEASGEGVDPNLFPRREVDGLHILLCARETAQRDADGWLRRVGWARDAAPVELMQLDPLSSGDVDAIVRSRDLAAPGEREEVVRSLDRLAGGDPLLVGLYLDELQARRDAGHLLSASALTKIRPGYEGFVAEWERVRAETGGRPFDEVGKALLSILSVARGALAEEELDLLVGTVLGRAHLVDYDAISAIDRFVARAAEGYVVAHPRIASFMREEYLATGAWIGRASSAILAWGRACMEGAQASPPITVPQYLLRSLAAHMLDADTAALPSLIEVPWLRAWGAAEQGGHAGLTDDARVVARSAFAGRIADRRASVAAAFRAKFTLCSVRSAASADELLPLGLGLGIVSPRRAIDWCLAVVDHQVGARLAQVVAYLDEPEVEAAWEAVSRLEPFSRVRAFRAIADRLSDDTREAAFLALRDDVLESKWPTEVWRLVRDAPTGQVADLLRTAMTVDDTLSFADEVVLRLVELPAGEARALVDELIDWSLPRSVWGAAHILESVPEEWRAAIYDRVVEAVFDLDGDGLAVLVEKLGHLFQTGEIEKVRGLYEEFAGSPVSISLVRGLGAAAEHDWQLAALGLVLADPSGSRKNAEAILAASPSPVVEGFVERIRGVADVSARASLLAIALPRLGVRGAPVVTELLDEVAPNARHYGLVSLFGDLLPWFSSSQLDLLRNLSEGCDLLDVCSLLLAIADVDQARREELLREAETLSGRLGSADRFAMLLGIADRVGPQEQERLVRTALDRTSGGSLRAGLAKSGLERLIPADALPKVVSANRGVFDHADRARLLVAASALVEPSDRRTLLLEAVAVSRGEADASARESAISTVVRAVDLPTDGDILESCRLAALEIEDAVQRSLAMGAECGQGAPRHR